MRIQTKVADNAGNETESETSTIRTKDIQGGLENIKIIPNETEWTNQNIEVEIQYPEEIEGLKKEYSINGNDWYEYVEPITIETNTIVYARLIDGDGQTGEIASIEIENIDKINPGVEAPGLISMTNKIEVTCNQTDGQSGINENTKQYRIRKVGDASWREWQSTNTFTGLKQNTEYEVQTKVADIAGNEAESEIGKISTTKIPGGAEIIITPSEDDWTNGDVEVEITWPEGTEDLDKKYSPDGGENWYDYEGPITVEENTEILARVEDEDGQTGEEQRIDISNIDKTSPGTEAPSLTSTTNKIEVTCNQNDNESGINETTKQYRIRQVGEEEWGEWQLSNIFTGLTQNTEYEVQTKVQDNAGNESESETSTIRTKDIQGGLENIKIIPNETEWTNQNIEVEIQYPEGIEGLKKEYSINGNDWYEYVEPIIIETNTIVYARLIDEAGQTGEIASIEIENIDKANPGTEAPGLISMTNKIEVTCNQNDSESGINEESKQYRIRQAGEEEWGEWQSSNVFTGLTQNTEYEVQTKVADNAGNEAESEIGKISTKKIPGGAEIIITPSEEDWTNQDIEVEITWPEGTENLDKKYSPDGGNNWYDYEGPITVEENTEIIARVEDEDGQTGEEQRIEINNIDKVNPGTEAPSLTSTTNKIEVTCNQTDSESGINETTKQYRIRQVGAEEWGAWQSTNTFTGLKQSTEYEVQTKVADNAGNEAESEIGKISTIKIPGGAEIIITPSEDDWTNENIEVEITWPEGTEDLDKKYSPDGGNNWYDYEGPITVEENTEIIARVEDENGQSGEEQRIEISNIDKTSPGTEEPTGTSTTNKIEVTCNQTDGQSGINETTKQYRIRKAGDEEWGAWQSSNIFTGLTQNTEYEVQTKVQDNVGNEAESEIGKISTTKIPGGTEIIITPSQDDWTNQDIEVEITWPRRNRRSRQKIQPRWWKQLV